MRSALCLAAALAALIGSEVPASGREKLWRFGGSYVRVSDLESRETLGSTWGGGWEYSFSDAELGEPLPGDVSVAASYHRFDHPISGTLFTSDIATFGLRWRGGQGATPSCDGFYGGLGVGLAWLRIEPSPLGTSPAESQYKLTVDAFIGFNFLKSLYLQIGYNKIGQFPRANLVNLPVTLGVRF